jgi:hypothetical protein
MRGISATRLVARQVVTPNKKIGPVRWHGGPNVTKDAPSVSVTFIQPDDTRKQVTALVGESLLQTAHRHTIDLEGACEGVCACSTCHIIIPMDLYDSLPERKS